MQNDAVLTYVGERNAKFKELTLNCGDFDSRFYIFAGKFRRYHNDSWYSRVFDVKTNLLNVRDSLYVLMGIFQALWLLIRKRPDIIFIKGGFVAVPIGLVARILKIPYITHDSDVIPGLTNRIIGKGAQLNTTGMPTQYYAYPTNKVRQVGIPLDSYYVKVDQTIKNKYREKLNIPIDREVLFVTGGSQGAKNINTAVSVIANNLLTERKNLYIIHQVGQADSNVYGSFSSERLVVKKFIDEMYLYSGAADVVVSRASMTTIAELGVQSKPVIIIPHPYLSDGHQLKNAELIKSIGGGSVLQESEIENNPQILADEIKHLLDNRTIANKYAKNLNEIIMPNSARMIAKMLLENK